MSTIVEVEDLSVSYSTPRGKLEAVCGASLDASEAEILGLVGESGSGKTTLALSLLRMNYPGRIVRGKIKVDSTDVLSLEGEALRRYRWEKVAMVFQSAMNALDPVMSIEAQIVETIIQHGRTSKREAQARVVDLLQMVSIDPSRARSYPHELSGGMCQRVGIAMALCNSPKVLIADEPTAALDVIVQATVLSTLKDLQKRFGLLVILISHDISIMSEVADRVAVMYAGKIVEIGQTHDIVDRPQHPYTDALIHAVPILGYRQRIVTSIPGLSPDLITPPQGCRFHPRCPQAFDRCRREEPPMVSSNGGKVSCWLRSKH